MASIRNVKLNIKAGQQEVLPLRGDGIRLVSANVPIYFADENGQANIDFFLEVGEQALFDEKIFTRLKVWHNSASDEDVVITVSEGSKFNGAKVSGVVSISSGIVTVDSGVIDLSGTALSQLDLIAKNSQVRKYGAAYSSSAALSAFTAVQVVAPASNLNGIKISYARLWSSHSTSFTYASLIAKSSAPAHGSDGDVIMSMESVFVAAGASINSCSKLENEIFIEAGKGLYFISNVTETSGSRGVLYEVL